jgi:DnaJ-class molecular chaperone
MPVVTIEEAYQILGVTSSTPEEDVKKAYKKLALRTHPGISELINNV